MGMLIMPLNSLAKVFPGEEPECRYRLTDFSALRGECVSFQIAYYWDTGTREYASVEVISKLYDCITLREVKCVPCEYPAHIDRDDDYISTVPGLYPDLLTRIKERGVDLIAGQWRSIWIDIEVPEDCAAGRYEIDIAFYRENVLLGKTRVDVEVIPAVLPKLAIPHTEWFHSDCIANYYHFPVFSEEYWSVVENFIRTAAKRGMNMILTPIFTPPLDTAVGGDRRTVQLVQVIKRQEHYEFDFTLLIKWIALCKSCGIEYFEISHLFSQWGAVAAPKIMATIHGEYKQLFGWNTVAGGAEYRRFLAELLPPLLEILSKHVDQERLYFHISDEPSLEQLDTYQAASVTVRKYLKGYRIIDALSNYELFARGLVDVPVCATDHIQPFLEHRPKELWSYYCTAQYKNVSNRFIAMPSYRNRIYGIQIYKYHIDGILHWGYNFYNSKHSLYPVNPYDVTGGDGAFPSGDPFLVYPGADGMPEESIRGMVFYEALADMRALCLLEKLIGREAVLQCIDADAVTFDKYPKTPEYIIGVRRAVNQKIKEAML